MSVKWGNYQSWAPKLTGPLEALPRPEARQYYKRLMGAKETRIGQLRSLLQASGVELGATDSKVQDLNDWFCSNVKADPDHPGVLLAAWQSVTVDIGLFLGDLLIERNPHLHWEFFSWGKSNISYQRAVIMGFRSSNPRLHMNIDVERIVSTYGNRIVASRGSIPEYGTVVVRGVNVDLDTITAGSHEKEIERDAFWRLLVDVAIREESQSEGDATRRLREDQAPKNGP